MTICNLKIDFDRSSEWERVVQTSRTASTTGITRPKPIPMTAFNLGATFTNPLVAIAVQTTQGKPHWKYGGKLRQSWNFSSGSNVGTAFSTIKSLDIKLGLNSVQIIELPSHSEQSYELVYYPPSWFKDVIIFGWKYLGQTRNFLRDSVFEIGNKIGTGTLNEPDSLTNLLANQSLILDRILIELDELRNDFLNSQGDPGISSGSIARLSENIESNNVRLDSKINELAKDLGRVLSGNDDPSILENNEQTIIEDELI